MEEYKKVNKTQARKLFNEGHSIFLVPCKARFGSMYYGNGCEIVKTVNDEGAFDRAVDEFTYYNCTSQTVGLYPAYYIKVS